ncbi:MAG: hypothetical protein ACK5O2_06585 [Microthrixaceae bacterium]
MTQRENTWVTPDVATLPGHDGGSSTADLSSGDLSSGDLSSGGLSAAGIATARGDAHWPEAHAADAMGAAEVGAGGPVGVGGVLDGGFDFLRAHFRLLLGLTAAMYLPLQIVDLVLVTRSGLSADVEGPQLMALGSVGTETAGSWVVLALRVVALSVLGMTAGVLTSDALGGHARSTGAVLREVARRCWVAALIPFLTVPMKVIGGCLAYVGFFLADALVMVASVLAGAERTGPFKSVGRSWRLAGRSLSTAIGISFGAFMISAILQIAVYAGPVLLASNFVASESVLIVIQQVSLLALLVTQPLTASIAARAYVELRCRSEALDLSLRARELGILA